MRTGLSRRGGPAGRCHPWLKLSKNHSQLRKLLPLYFPSNSVNTTPESTSTCDDQTKSKLPISSRPLRDVNQIRSGESTPLENGAQGLTCSAEESEKCDSTKLLLKDPAWDIDEDATIKLHESMNTSLIYESLNISPIHWKCVPQIHGLPVKHSAALCGVIIKKKRKRRKRIHDLPTSREKHSAKRKSHENSNSMERSVTPASEMPDSPIEEDACKAVDPHHNESRSPQNDLSTTITMDSPKPPSTPGKLATHAESKADVPSCGTVSTPSGTKEKSTDSTHSLSKCFTCRVCQVTLSRGSRIVQRFCSSCIKMLQQFARDYVRPEDLSCLRDTPCSVQWPAEPFNPEAPHTVRSVFRPLEEKYGYVAPEWCVPCKVVHSLRLGVKFTNLRGIAPDAAQALSQIDLNVLDDPVFQHRGRLRHAQAYLSQLTQDYKRKFSSNEIAIEETNQLDNQTQRSHPVVSRLLDALWVRPIRLASRAQLKENITPPEPAGLNDNAIIAVQDENIDDPHSPKTETTVIANYTSTTATDLSTDMILPVSSSEQEKTTTASSVKTNGEIEKTETTVASELPPSDPVALTVLTETPQPEPVQQQASSDEPRVCTSPNLNSSSLCESQVKDHGEDLSQNRVVQPNCTLCRFRCDQTVQPTAIAELPMVQLMFQQNNYAITVGPTRLRSRTRESATTSITLNSPSTLATPIRNAECSGTSSTNLPTQSQFEAAPATGSSSEETSQNPDPVNGDAGQCVEDNLPPSVTTERNATDIGTDGVLTGNTNVCSATDQLTDTSASVETGALEKLYIIKPNGSDPQFLSQSPSVPTDSAIEIMHVEENEGDKSQEAQHIDCLPEVEGNGSNADKKSLLEEQLEPEQSASVVEIVSLSKDQTCETTELSQEPSSIEPILTAHPNDTVSSSTIQPISASDDHLPSPHTSHADHCKSPIVNEIEVCAACLCKFRFTLRSFLDRFHAQTIDCVSELLQNPSQFCTNRDCTGSPPRQAAQSQASCDHCDSCFLYKFLSEICTVLQPSLDKSLQHTKQEQSSATKTSANRLKSCAEFILPVGGPLIITGPRISQSPDDSLYARLQPPVSSSATDPINATDERHRCTCCYSPVDPFLHRYLVGSDPNQTICSGCLWTWLAQVHAAYHDPGVQRIARRLASAAAVTDACVPLLSSASRCTLVDTARLAQLLSVACTGACKNPCTIQSPLWLACPGCVIRRVHRLFATRLPLYCPRWYRRRVQLICKSKSAEDLDPRLVCSQHADTTVHHRLALVDVEYTDAVIERWLLPPEPPTIAEPLDCTQPNEIQVAESDSAESETDEDMLSDTSSGVSSNTSPLRIEAHETEYGAEDWWDECYEPADESSKMNETTQECSAVKDSSTEPEVDEPLAEEMTMDFVAPKRQRRLTQKAAEAAEFWRRLPRTSSHSLEKPGSEDPPQSKIELDVEPVKTYARRSLKREEIVSQSVDPSSTPDDEPINSTFTEVGKDAAMDDSDSASKRSAHDLSSPVPSPKAEAEQQKHAKTQSGKRKLSHLAEPLIRSKRSLKINPRFFDDYSGQFPSLIGEGREIRDRSPVEEDADDSEPDDDGAESSTRRLSDQRGSKQTRPSTFGRSSHITSRGRYESRHRRHSNVHDETDSKPSFSSQKSTGLGPRVKQVSRHALKPDPDRYGPTISAMVHAARLAAVGAKIPGGTSPNHAALAATARASTINAIGSGGTTSDLAYGDSDEHASFDESEGGAGGSSHWSSINRSQVSDSGRRLPLRCGQCPACIGLIQACGRCTNCRLLQQQSSTNETSRTTNIGPCKQLICFRRRSENMTGKSGPRVKLPTSFASSGAAGSSFSSSPTAVTSSTANKSSSNSSFVSGPTGHVRHYRAPRQSNSPRSAPSDAPASVSLSETVPGLAQQLEADAWLAQIDRTDSQSSMRGKGLFHSTVRHDSMNVYSHKPLTPIHGGDLGMRFNGASQKDESDVDKDRIRPVEGEVITSELAHHGGYAIVTTMASAPPKEICYACGSGGGQLLFCVSCAEPYHFYCVERQFRPRRKDHFICRNCTECGQCHKPAADLRCLRCSTGYHPSCLPEYPPAHSGQRGNWTCPHCATCIHCGAKPFKSLEPSDPHRTISSSTSSSTTTTSTSISSSIIGSSNRVTVIPWSSDVNKCAACSAAEARGDVCPECDRAYLPTAKQMIQCDSCQLWMHRACTKLTVDEYEWIARLPPGRLNQFVVNCSVCQNEKGQQQQQQQYDSATGARALPEGENQSLPRGDSLTVDVTSSQANNQDQETDGASRLRSMARDTLLVRMAGLVSNCRQSSRSPNSPSSVPPTTTNNNNPNGGSENSAVVAPSSTTSCGSLTPSGQGPASPPADRRQFLEDSDCGSTRDIPQLDGAGDVDSGEDENISYKRTPPTSNRVFKPRTRTYSTDPFISRASDALLDEHEGAVVGVQRSTPFLSNRSNGGTNTIPGNGTMAAWGTRYNSRVPQDLFTARSTYRQKHSRADGSDSERLNVYPMLRLNTFTDDDKSAARGAVLPANAAWLVEDESEQIWTSPRALIYRLLTRILHKLSAHPMESPHTTALRRLLRWLNLATETMFPWLNLSDMASDVRDVLRQMNGEFVSVLKHFERLALIELHELICPVVARLSEAQLHGRLPVSGMRVTNCVSTVQSLHSTIMHHLKSHHSHLMFPASNTPALPADIPTEWRALAEAKLVIAQFRPSQCNRPHELEVMDRMRNESREERWVEHWSTIEEEMVLQYFQRHLVRLANRLRYRAQEDSQQNDNSGQPDLSASSNDVLSEVNKPLSNREPVITDSTTTVIPSEHAKTASTSPTILSTNPLDEAFQDVASVLAADQQNQSEDLPSVPSQTHNFEPNTMKQIADHITDVGKQSEPSPMPVQVQPFYFARGEFWTAAVGNATASCYSSTGITKSDRSVAEVDLDLDPDSADEDARCCLLCGHHGDSNIEGRLLFTGADTWVHVNCALWSNEVYEEETGQLIGLSDALRRARTSVCGDCGRFGATMVCSNAHDPVCTLHFSASTAAHIDIRGVPSGMSCHTDKAHAVHFACALRRRPPAPRSVFTADRSWFCSPECHRAMARQRLTDGIREMRRARRSLGRCTSMNNRGRSARFDLASVEDDEEANERQNGDGSLLDPMNDASTDPFLDKDELVELENSVADDLEPISLGELLVCRRVFVPSDCFAASLYPASTTARSSSYRPWIAPDDNPKLQTAAQLAVKNLAVSPNSLAFLQCTGLAANSLVITIGSLRVDRLGEVREASDALASVKSHLSDSTNSALRRWNYLCPINYRARRIFWSCTKLDARISYTLHVRQTYTMYNPSMHVPVGPPPAKPSSGRSSLLNSPATTTSSTTSNRLLDAELRKHSKPIITRLPQTSPREESVLPPRPGFPSAPLPGVHEKIFVNPGSQSNTTSTTTSQPDGHARPQYEFHASAVASTVSMSVPTNTSNSSEVQKTPHNSFPNHSTTPTTVLSTNPSSMGQLSCRINRSTDASADSPSEMKIVKAVSLAKTTRFPHPSSAQLGHMQITCSGSINTVNPINAVRAHTPSNVTTVRPLVLRTSHTVTLNPGSFPRNQVLPNTTATQSSVTAVPPSEPKTLTTLLTKPLSGITPPVRSTTSANTTVRLTGRTTDVIRIQHMPGQRSGTLTTPTKDLQLAIQLNGLFQNIPTNRSVRPLPIANPCRQLPLSHPNPSPVIRSETAPRVTRLLPQLDGTLDLDEDYCPEESTARPSRKRVRPSRYYHLRRAPSVTSNDSSNSTRSNRTHRRHLQRPHKRHRSASSSSSSTHTERRQGRQSRNFSKQVTKFAVSPPPSPRGPVMRRRWIEERNRQQELAHLVSKAKQANQARLYQNEVEKHARAYRLRFAIDGVVRAAANPAVAWQTVLSRVAALRERHGLSPLIYSSADGWTQFGLNHRHVVFLIEQMRGAFHCYRYRFHYHRRKVERLRQKFTPPVPLAEGCARALMWTKPRLPAHHARDPLNFLSCASNPPPRPLFKPSQAIVPCSLSPNSKAELTPSTTGDKSGLLLSPGEPATMLSPNEQVICAEAARQAASLVATQLKLPLRVREAYIARAVVQATGLPITSTGSLNLGGSQDKENRATACSGTQSDPWTDGSTEDEGDDADEREELDDEEEEENVDLGTISTQFKRLVSGSMARLLRVTVHPSRIHGRGLFALREFREDEMVIEYLGERIRNLVCETREVRYRAAGVDCYMFRIDPDWVIDATYAGNAARFINHSCEPNCYAKVISVDDKKHIIILAQRRIYPGEELTYDYRFPKESDKLLCNCGSYMCRRYLN